MIASAFILSAGRSGSTLLDRLIGAHPEALAVGELRQLPKNIALNSTCSCGARIDACDFWRPVIDEIGARMRTDLWRTPYQLDLGYIRAAVEIDHQRQTSLYKARRVATLALAEAAMRMGANFNTSPALGEIRRQAQNNELLHEVLRRQTGRRLVVDSSKGFRYSIGQYLLSPTSERMLLLTRDCRGVMASMMRGGTSAEVAARAWVRYYERATAWLARHVAPGDVLHVRYEDLVGDTAAALRRVFAFVNLAPIEASIAMREHPSHIANGNPMRHAAMGTLRLDERWRSELKARDIAVFRDLARPMCAKLGYALDDEAVS